MRLSEPMKIANLFVYLTHFTNVYITVESKCTQCSIMPINHKRTVCCSEHYRHCIRFKFSNRYLLFSMTD